MKLFCGKIDSFEIVTLHLSGMRFTTEYEIVMKDGQAEVSEYTILYGNQEDRRRLDRRVLCGIETALKLLNDCKVLSWDGFSGPHPRGVLDGIMFRFSAVVNGGKNISAQGSQNFPRHFHDFRDGLYQILRNEEAK